MDHRIDLEIAGIRENNTKQVNKIVQIENSVTHNEDVSKQINLNLEKHEILIDQANVNYNTMKTDYDVITTNLNEKAELTRN